MRVVFRRLDTLLPVVLLAACAGGGGDAPADDGVQRAAIGQLVAEARDGQVATALAFLNAAAGRVAPFAGAQVQDDVPALAPGAGCVVIVAEEDESILAWSALAVGDRTVDLLAHVRVSDGIVRVDFEAVAADVETVGTLACTVDPERGTLVQGGCRTGFAGGEAVDAAVEELRGRVVADAAGHARGVFLSGNVGLSLVPLGLAGSAAIAGPTALVSLGAGTFYSLGEVPFGA